MIYRLYKVAFYISYSGLTRWSNIKISDASLNGSLKWRGIEQDHMDSRPNESMVLYPANSDHFPPES